MKQAKYGQLTAGPPSERKQLNIIDFVQANFNDNRTVTVSEVEDGSYCITVENAVSTGRNPQSSIWLSKESVVAMSATILVYFGVKGISMEDMLKEAVKDGIVDYKCSDNITSKL